VALALVGDPDLVFLDEPTTGFDPSARREAWNMIEGLKAMGKTVFLTTHYMDEAQNLSDRVAILRAGRIVALGPPDRLGAAGEQGATIIRLRSPDGATPETLGGELGEPLEVSGDELLIRTRDPQRVLFRLLAWADREHVELAGLDVRRPSLEDVFLELTAEPGGDGG
jgi:ABC-2 type transport system ATP-binding protein